MTPEELKTKRLFISYGHDSFFKVAKRLAEDLKPYVASVWFDEKDIHQSSVWPQEIEKGIENCDIVLAFMTEHAYRKPAGVCVNEIVYASNKKKKICPILVQSMDIPLILCAIQYFDITSVYDPQQNVFLENQYQEKLQQLIKSLLDESFDYVGYLKDLKSYFNPQNKLNEHASLCREYVGRKWLEEKFASWLISDSSLLFIVGKPGCGKSAFATHLALTYPEIKGIHYCEYNDRNSLSLASIIKTLAFYLLSQFNDYAEMFGDLNLNKLDSMSVEELFRFLIAAPLKEMGQKKNEKTAVIIIDGLDEIGTKDASKLLTLFSAFQKEMPPFFKIVFTSRPNSGYLRLIKEFNPLEIELSSQDNMKDLEVYIKASHLGSKLTAGQVQKLLRKSEGVFQYAKSVLDEMETNPAFDFTSLPFGLSGLYEQDFERIFPDDSFDNCRPLLEILVAAETSLDKSFLAEILDDEYALKEGMDKLGSYLSLNESKISFYHKSLFDWLTDDSNEFYYISKKAGDKKIVRYIESNLYPTVFLSNPYIREYGLLHLYEEKKYNSICQLLATKNAEVIELFSNFISNSILKEEERDFLPLFMLLANRGKESDAVFSRLIKVLLEKGQLEACSLQVVSPLKNTILWIEKYYELCLAKFNCDFPLILNIFNEMLKSIQDEDVLNEIYDYVGDAYRLLGNHEQAFFYYEKVIDSIPPEERVKKCFPTLYNYNDLKYVTGHLKEAEGNMTSYLPAAGEDHYKKSKIFRHLANINWQTGQVLKARELYQEACEEAKKAYRPISVAECLESIAKTYVGEDNDLALSLALEAEKITKRYNYKEIYAKTFFPRIERLISLKKYQEAIDLCKEPESIFTQMKYQTALSRCFRYEAICYFNLEDYEKSLEFSKTALGNLKRSNSFPGARIFLFLLALQAGKKTGKLSQIAKLESLDDIYYQEFPNLKESVEQIQKMLSEV